MRSTKSRESVVAEDFLSRRGILSAPDLYSQRKQLVTLLDALFSGDGRHTLAL